MGKFKVQAKHCRRLGENVTGKAKFDKILTTRNYPPGVHGQKGRGRMSQYGVQLREKQKARLTYGLMEKQFAGYYKKASTSSTNTGEELLRLLERRLDNVVYRVGLATTRAQARQLVSHCHIRVNGKRLNVPSYLVKKGDVIEVRDKSKNLSLIKDSVVSRGGGETPNWIDFDADKLSAQIIHLPEASDLELGIDSRLIVEYYSK